MPVDLDAPARASLKFFGDAAQAGGKITYTALNKPPFLIDGLFDEAWRSLAVKNFRGGGIAPISTTKPVLGVRQADVPAGVTLAQGDTLVRANGQRFEVADVQPDGFGWQALDLNSIDPDS